MPSSPKDGEYYTVISDDASTSNTVVSGNGNNIIHRGAVVSSYPLTARESISVIFIDGDWRSKSLEV